MKDAGGLGAQDVYVDKTGVARKERAAHHLRLKLSAGAEHELKAQRQLNLLGAGATNLRRTPAYQGLSSPF
jgi:hypothetical protein